jgi:hypothetical protein
MMDGKSFWELDPVLFKGDASAVMARRTLDRLIRAEVAEGLSETVPRKNSG